MKKENRTPSFLSALFLFLLFTLFPGFMVSADSGEEEAATVVALRGKIQAVDESGIVRSLSVKSPIYAGDTIKTGKKGRIQILFTDNTIYSLGRNSEIKITEYLWKPKATQGSLKTKIKEGVFRVMGGAITKVSPENFITETPAATIGIRGSMYAGKVNESSLSVVFNGGKGIVVSNEFGSVVISRPGHGTHVQLSSKPDTPAKFNEQDVAELNQKLESPADAEIETNIDTPIIEAPPVNEFSPAIDISDPEEIPTDPTDPPPDLVNAVTNYTGTITGNSVIASDSSVETINETSWTEINWYNGKIIGRIPAAGLPPIFFMGDVAGDTISNITFLGSDNGLSNPSPGLIAALSGSGSGTVSGPEKDFYTLNLSGVSYEMQPPDQPIFDTWSAIDSGVRGPLDPEDTAAPTGTAIWKGFVTGISENMANIDTARRLFISHDLGDFALSIDKDQGTVSGFLSAEDASTSTSFLNGITIGGASDSAFILEDNLAARITCPGGNCVDTSGAKGGLKNYGNFLISLSPQDPANDISDYVTWGYWEIAYEDPSTGGQYHTHVPGSRWIAGEPTPVADVNALTTANFSGHYSGTTFADKIDKTAIPGSPQVKDLQGTFMVDVDFGNISNAGAVTGTISLPGETVLTVDSGVAGNASASGFINGSVSGAAQSDFNGAFYGPGAQSIGGNFYADFNSGISYIGIYVGNR